MGLRGDGLKNPLGDDNPRILLYITLKRISNDRKRAPSGARFFVTGM